MRVDAVRFKRTEDADWEVGVIINEGSGNLLDHEGVVMTECWNWASLDIAMFTVPDTVDVQKPRLKKPRVDAVEAQKAVEDNLQALSRALHSQKWKNVVVLLKDALEIAEGVS